MDQNKNTKNSGWTSWAFFLLGLASLTGLLFLKARIESFDSSAYGLGNMRSGLRAAQSTYEMRQLLETIDLPVTVISLVVVLVSGYTIWRNW